MAAFVSRYACAFADVVTDLHGDAAALDRQLDDLLATWNGSAELRDIFSNPAVDAKRKIAILDKLNEKMGLQKELRNLVAVMIDHGRVGSINEVVAAYRAQLKQRQGIHQAEIVTARTLGSSEQATLIGEVERVAGKRIEAIFKEDKNILGGAVVRIGSTVYDGSVRGRLDRLKEALIAG